MPHVLTIQVGGSISHTPTECPVGTIVVAKPAMEVRRSIDLCTNTGEPLE